MPYQQIEQPIRHGIHRELLLADKPGAKMRDLERCKRGKLAKHQRVHRLRIGLEHAVVLALSSFNNFFILSF